MHVSDREHFDMLPFIAILMCTLGCLLYVTLIISSLCIGPGAGEGWIPMYDKNQPRKLPVLIEWDGKKAIVHRENGRRVPMEWAGQQTITIPGMGTFVVQLKGADKSPMGKFIAELEKKKATHYALFAVRPSGFDSFQTIAGDFRSKGIDVGYEPIEEGRPVRLMKGKS